MLLGGDALAVMRPPAWWGRDPAGPDGVALRLVVPPDALHAVGYALRDATAGAGWLRGSVGAGTLIAGLPAELRPQRVVGVVETLRHTLVARGGMCTVLRAAPAVHEAVLESDPTRPAAEARKARFDPAGRLSPGRLPLLDVA
jgi:glycolate oxidase FAD binding subunit